VSADYDKIAGFFEDLDLYLSRLKILEKWVPPVPELKVALAQVLTSVLVLCGICAKYVLMKRFGNCTFSSAPFLESFFWKLSGAHIPYLIVWCSFPGTLQRHLCKRICLKDMSLTSICLKTLHIRLRSLYSKPSNHSATDMGVPLVKAFRNLVSGEDDELTAAYAQFHKMVEQEQGAVRNATLAAIEQVKKETSSMRTDVSVVLATTKRTEADTKTLVASTGRMHIYLESKTVSGHSSFWRLRRFEGREAALERDEILKGLSSLNFHDKQRDVFQKHHQGTGQWLLKTDEFQQWFMGEQNSTLWCPGIRMSIFWKPPTLASWCLLLRLADGSMRDNRVWESEFWPSSILVLSRFRPDILTSHTQLFGIINEQWIISLAGGVEMCEWLPAGIATLRCLFLVPSLGACSQRSSASS